MIKKIILVIHPKNKQKIVKKMKTLHLINIIIISFFISENMLIAQPTNPKSPKGIVISEGGCDSECCWGRIQTYFFEDGNCVYQSIDEKQDRLTYYGTWKLEDSLIVINYKTKFYGKPVGEPVYNSNSCDDGIKNSLYIAVKEDMDLQDVINWNEMIRERRGYDYLIDPTVKADFHKYRADFSCYNFLTTQINQDRQRVYSEQYLATLNSQQLRFLRNGIFAKYGLIFKNKELKEYFEQQYEYDGIYEDVSAFLNQYDRKNIELIKKFENY
jgi:hypothetical protein